MFEFYTDGAVKGNKNSTKKNCIGGIGVYCKELGLEISKKYENATNNKMELTAILESLKYIKTNNISDNIIIYSDSDYSVKCCTIWYKSWNSKPNGWKDKKNVDLIKAITELLEGMNNVRLQWCRGHAGIPGNEKADYLANLAYS